MDLSAHEEEITIPLSSTYVGAHSHGHNSFLLHHDSSYVPPTIAELQYSKKRSSLPVRYRECLKNHAASIGGNATDGCGEFMPSGKEGSLGALKCSACGCHRNFHRKEFQGSRKPTCAHMGGFGYPQGPKPHSMIMPLGAAAAQTLWSDEMEGAGGVGYPRPQMLKKRVRTKFSAEQKEKMLAFAEKAGWKLHKLEEGVVQLFCREIGVKRRALKVWMHNNKHKAPLPSSLSEIMNE